MYRATRDPDTGPSVNAALSLNKNLVLHDKTSILYAHVHAKIHAYLYMYTKYIY